MKKLIFITSLIFIFPALTCLCDSKNDVINFPGTDVIQPVVQQKIFEKKSFTIDNGETSKEPGPGFRVGIFRSGPYAGYDLVYATYDIEEPCKGGPCPEAHIRFARKGNLLVYLSRISWSSEKLEFLDSFQKLGFIMKEDNSYTIPSLEYPGTISSNRPNQLITFVMERTGTLDTTMLTKIFQDKVMGDIYTTIENKPDPYGMIDDNRHSSPFFINDFFVFRLDGTYLEYRYYPEIFSHQVDWGTQSLPLDTNYFDRIDPCESIDGERIGPDIIPTSEVNSEKDLTVVGQVKDEGPIYFFKDPANTFLKNMYQKYHDDYTEQEERYSHSSNPTKMEPMPDYQQFIDSKPVFFWRDPFGRLERFIKLTYRPPCMAEPIIYLYPVHKEIVEINLDIKGKLTASYPSYQQGWKITADPSGLLTSVFDGKSYAQLFWEGWSHIFSTPPKGFVVKQSEVSVFFRTILPQLGLDQRESEDFIKAWSPRFSNAPFYFITFIDESEIDLLAPLRISPKPDTVIRILMDYKPLQEPIAVQPPSLPKPSERKGFTVIEWGGLTR